MRAGMNSCGRKKLPRAASIAGDGGFATPQNPSKYGVLAMARRLLRNLREFCMPLMQRAMPESCHVACPWRCVVGHRRPPGADVVKAAVARQPGRGEPVCFLRGCLGNGGF